jgi:hypothetical protein
LIEIAVEPREILKKAVFQLPICALFGFVIDFIYFHWKFAYFFPAFNVADSAICVGVGILMLDLLLQKQQDIVPDEKEGIATVSLNLNTLNQFREKFPVWKDADEFHL